MRMVGACGISTWYWKSASKETGRKLERDPGTADRDAPVVSILADVSTVGNRRERRGVVPRIVRSHRVATHRDQSSWEHGVAVVRRELLGKPLLSTYANVVRSQTVPSTALQGPARQVL